MQNRITGERLTVDWFVMLAASTIVGATFGALAMALFSSRSYDRGYDDALSGRVTRPSTTLDYVE